MYHGVTFIPSLVIGIEKLILFWVAMNINGFMKAELEMVYFPVKTNAVHNENFQKLFQPIVVCFSPISLTSKQVLGRKTRFGLDSSAVNVFPIDGTVAQSHCI